MTIKKTINASPLKRLAVPHDVARALAFMMDDENEYITGENLTITGGSVK